MKQAVKTIISMSDSITKVLVLATAIAITPVLSAASVADKAADKTAEITTKTTSQTSSQKGGTLKTTTLMWPATFNQFVSTGAYISVISGFVQASLLTSSEDDWSPIPYLAKKWQVSKDMKTLTFELDPKATFSSGKPVTSADVKFTFDLIFDEKKCLKCASYRGYIGKLEGIKIHSPQKISITTADVHFFSLRKVGGVPILEKAFYDKGDFNKDFHKVIHGAGPYLYDAEASAHKKQIVLQRRKDFGLDHPYHLARYNFDTIIFKYIADKIVEFEAFKRGDTDFYYFNYDAFKFWENTGAKVFQNPDVTRLEYPFNNPNTFHLVAFNMRKGKMDDPLVRQALDHLLNRDLVVKKIYGGHNQAVGTPFPAGPYSQNPKPTPFDPKNAGQLLTKAGFKAAGSDGIFYRINAEGKKERASYSLIHTKQAYEPWLTIFIEDAKKAGVELKVRLVDWSVLGAALQDFSWEMAAFGLNSGPVPLPRPMWHSESAMSPGSSNYMGLASSEVDRLLESIATTMDPSKRYPLYHQLEKKLIDLRPMMLLWSQKKHYVAYWKKNLNPTKTPYYFYSGDQLAAPFYLHWTAAAAKN